MPWSIAQNHLFNAAADNPEFAAKVGIPQPKASQMASEGIKTNNATSQEPRAISQRTAAQAVPVGLKRQTKPQRLAMALSKYAGKPNLPGI